MEGTFRIIAFLRSDNCMITPNGLYSYPDSLIPFNNLRPGTTYSYEVSVTVMPPGIPDVSIGYTSGEFTTAQTGSDKDESSK